MEKRPLMRIGSTLILACSVWIIACRTTTSGTDQQVPAAPPFELDHINASVTGTPGQYQVRPSFEKLTQVYVVQRESPRTGARRILEAPDDYTFDTQTGALALASRIDDEKEMVVVEGVRRSPWSWQIGEAIEADSVRILLGEREAQRGRDFEVDGASGRIWLLRPAALAEREKHYVTYRCPADPTNPRIAHGGSIGNADPAAVRKFHGLPDQPQDAERARDSVGTNASATSDPRRWTIVQPMDPAGLRVAVATKGKPGDLKWLERSKDYTYDPTGAEILFLRDIPVDPGKEYVFVSGVPLDRGVFFAHKSLTRGQVAVTVNAEVLSEGEGFTVDYDKGRIDVLGAAIRSPDAKFKIAAAGWTYSN